jgi:hypothetical protein
VIASGLRFCVKFFRFIAPEIDGVVTGMTRVLERHTISRKLLFVFASCPTLPSLGIAFLVGAAVSRRR